MPFPLPTPQGAGIGNSGTSPRPRFEGCARQPSGQRATSANLFRKECQGWNEARKPSCTAPQFNLPRRLSPPSHGSADRRLRPVPLGEHEQTINIPCSCDVKRPRHTKLDYILEHCIGLTKSHIVQFRLFFRDRKS
jgi:hypothetical protein